MMHVKKLDAVLVYLAHQGGLTLIEDVDSLLIFLSAHDFPSWTEKQVKSTSASLTITDRDFEKAQNMLSSSEKTQLDSYLLLCEDIGDLPSFDAEPIVSKRSIEPYVQLKQELSDVDKIKQDLYAKEERLLGLQEALEAKEQLLHGEAESLHDPQIRMLLQRIEDRTKHFDTLVQQHRHLQDAQYERMHGYVERESQLKLSIAELTRTQATLQREIISIQNMVTTLEQKKLLLDSDVREKNKELLVLNRNISEISKRYKRELDEMEETRRALAAKEDELDESYDRLHSFKDELIAKQVSLEEKESHLFAELEHEKELLRDDYAQRVKELERKYARKQKDLVRKTTRASVRHEIEKKMQDKSHKKDDVLADVKMLIGVARSECELNPQLAKNTYMHIAKLYESLSKAEQALIHDTLVSLYKQISGRLDTHK